MFNYYNTATVVYWYDDIYTIHTYVYTYYAKQKQLTAVKKGAAKQSSMNTTSGKNN